MIRPPRLHPGSRIAVLAPSGGLAARFPAVYRRGLTNLRKVFGFEITEMPTAAMTGEELHDAPQRRVEDLHAAFRDSAVDGILTTIGGDDSMRLLPLLDPTVALEHPKPVMGGSDATTFLSHFARHGLVTFYGPSVMAGFAQTANLPDAFTDHVKTFLFDEWSQFEYAAYTRFTHGYRDWSNPAAAAECEPFTENPGRHVLQGTKTVAGRLWGGCLEVLEFLKGTDYWPEPGFWDDTILFLETSEEKPPPRWVGYFLRNYGLQGVLGRIRALLIGRAKDYTAEENEKLRRIVKTVVAEEFGEPDLPVIMDMDFGHTDPKHILPLGARAEVDPRGRTVRLLESPFA